MNKKQALKCRRENGGLVVETSAHPPEYKHADDSREAADLMIGCWLDATHEEARLVAAHPTFSREGAPVVTAARAEKLLAQVRLAVALGEAVGRAIGRLAPAQPNSDRRAALAKVLGVNAFGFRLGIRRGLAAGREQRQAAEVAARLLD